MLAATILHSLSAVCVLLIVIGFGVFLARKGWFDAPSHRGNGLSFVTCLKTRRLQCGTPIRTVQNPQRFRQRFFTFLQTPA